MNCMSLCYIYTQCCCVASKGNTMGVARLAEALHAHVWPTMSMKPCGQSDIHATKDMSAEEQLLAVGLDAAEQDPGGESFEKMFAKFTEMKGNKFQYNYL